MRKFAASAVLALVMAAPASRAIADNPFDHIVPLVKAGERVPSTPFIDQDERRLTFANLRGSAVAVTFIYTRCKDACPLITQKFAQAHASLGDGPFRFVEVTIDPNYDTPRVIADYAGKHGIEAPGRLVLTGTPGAVTDFERRMGVSSIETGSGEILHNDRLVLVAKDGTVADIIEGSSWTPADIAAQMQNAAGLRSSWLDRFDLALGAAVAYCGSAISGRAGIGDLVASVGVFGGAIAIFTWLVRRVFASPT